MNMRGTRHRGSNGRDGITIANSRHEKQRSHARRLFAEMLEDRRMLTLTTTDLTTGLTPTDLVHALVGSGVTVSNVKFTGSNLAGGLFANALSDGLGIDSGVALSSGKIANAAGPNNSEATSAQFGLPGDSDLTKLIPGFTTHDAAVLEFDFLATGKSLSFQYVFASEEYNEFVNSTFNDVFGFFLDGANIALLPGTTTPVSINTVNKGLNSNFYHNNSLTDFGSPTPFGTQADGFTVPLLATATIVPGLHHIKLAIADAGDDALDSWVFLTGQSFVIGNSDLAITSTASPEPVVEENTLTYTLVVTNNGPDPATGVTVQDTLPAGVTFAGATPSQGTVSQTGGVVTAAVGILANGASATIKIAVVPSAVGTITNTATVKAFQVDDVPDNNTTSVDATVTTPGVSIDDVQVVEGDSGLKDAVFTVSLSGALQSAAIQVTYMTADVTAHAGYDYVAVGGVLTIAPGAVSGTITVPIIGDLLNESTETFLMLLSSPVNVRLDKSQGTGTIFDNDPIPVLYVNDVHVTTVNPGEIDAVFAVALDRPSGQDVTVQFATADGTAKAGTSYSAVSGTLVIPAGSTKQLVTVPVLTSAVYAANQKFYLNLSGGVHADILDGQGVATIIFADPPVAEYIVDDQEDGYSQTPGWTNVTNTQAYHLDYDYHLPGTGTDTATWKFSGILPGSYQVFARWVPFSNRATNAPYTILDGNTPQGTVLVNQQLAPTGDQSNGITWQSLGTFNTATGTLAVKLGDNANGYVVADAIRIVAGGIAPQVPEMDVAGGDQSIIDGENGPSYLDGTEFGSTVLLTDAVVHTFTITNTGNATLHLTGSPLVSVLGANPLDFTVVTQPAATIAAGSTSTFQVKFDPTTSGLRKAIISIANDDASEHPYTFAIEGTGTSPGANVLELDDSMSGYSQSGGWTSTTNAVAFDGQYHATSAGQGNHQSTWTFTNLTPGHYEVSATWVPLASGATNAPFVVTDGSTSQGTFLVNQQQWPNGAIVDRALWQTLTSLDVTTGTVVVTLSDQANGAVVADAIRLVRTYDLSVPPVSPVVRHNAQTPQDVNADGHVTALDVLLVINDLSAQAASNAATPNAGSLVAASATTPTYYWDVNGDGLVSPLDALLVINYLNRPTVTPSAAPVAALAPAAVDSAFNQSASSSPAASASASPTAATLSTAAASSTQSVPSASSPLLLQPANVRAAFASTGKKATDVGSN